MNRTILRSRHWLHPLTWMAFVISFKYITGMLSVGFAGPFPIFTYVFAVICLALPLWYFASRRIDWALVVPSHSQNLSYTIAWLVALVIFGVYWHEWTYIGLQSGTPMLLQITMIGAILCSAVLLHLTLHTRRWLIASLILFTQSVILIHIGFRDWMVISGLLYLMVIHRTILTLNWSHLVITVLLFVFVIAPSTVIFRTALTDPDYNQDPVAQLAHEYSNYPEHVQDVFHRMGSEGLLLAHEIDRKRHFKTNPNLIAFGKDLGNALLPSGLRKGSKQLRPGESIYQHYFDSDAAISFPSGIIGDSIHYFGIYAFLLLPIFGIALGLFAKLMGQTMVGLHSYAGLLFLYQYVFWDTHLIFMLTSWTRGLVIIGGWLLLLSVINRVSEFIRA
jgi:hypothetical protein